jgi:hypothetical protein
VENYQIASSEMNTFALSDNYIALGCQNCDKYLGRIEIFGNKPGYPTIFTKKGTKKKNFFFGGQTEIYQKGKMTFVYIASQLSALTKSHYINIIQLTTD